MVGRLMGQVGKLTADAVCDDEEKKGDERADEGRDREDKADA